MKILCLNCKKEFKPRPNQKYCFKSCYYEHNKGRIEEQRLGRLSQKKKKTYPQWVDDTGNIHQLDFDPKLNTNKFLRFLKEKAL